MSPRIRLVVGRSRSRPPRSRFVFVSAVVHGAAIAGMLFFPTLWARDRVMDDPFVVVSLAPAGSPAPVVRTPEPEPEPEPAETAPPETATVVPEVPEPAPEPEKIEPPKPKEPEKKPEPRKEPPRRTTKTPAETPPDSRTSPAPGESGGGSSDITSLDVEDVEFAWYRDRVSAALKSHWRQPVLEGLRESLGVTISFRIRRDGSVSDPRIDATSGVPSLDRSALRAVIEADPLPPLPPTWNGSTMTARFVFRWYP